MSIHPNPIDSGIRIISGRSWENNEAIRHLLTNVIGENVDREGLKETPRRFIKALEEMTRGYRMNAEQVLETQFNEGKFDEMIVLRSIEFTSLCEHHLLPFSGTVDIAYLPLTRIIGISKLCRLVEMFACRLQVQERMTQQIGETLFKSTLNPLGVGVIVKAHHHCMSCRGVRQKNTEMITSHLSGNFKVNPEVRAEFLKLCE